MFTLNSVNTIMATDEENAEISTRIWGQPGVCTQVYLEVDDNVSTLSWFAHSFQYEVEWHGENAVESLKKMTKNLTDKDFVDFVVYTITVKMS